MKIVVNSDHIIFLHNWEQDVYRPGEAQYKSGEYKKCTYCNMIKLHDLDNGKWYVKFYWEAAPLNKVFNYSNDVIFNSSEEARKAVDSFLIRYNKLAGFL